MEFRLNSKMRLTAQWRFTSLIFKASAVQSFLSLFPLSLLFIRATSSKPSQRWHTGYACEMAREIY